MVLYSAVLRLLTVAGKLDEAGSHAAYHKVMDAVACFEKGNEMLAEVLKEQDKISSPWRASIAMIAVVE